MRHIGGAREILGQGAANEGREIVKQCGRQKPCFLALRFRKIAVKKGVREQTRALRPFHWRSGLCPIQEFLSHHGFESKMTLQNQFP